LPTAHYDWDVVERLRLAELLGSLSLATDMGTASPPETALGTTITATRLAQRSGLSGRDLATTYYAGITRMLGCTATAMEGASLAAGEDQRLNLALLSCDWSDASEVEAALGELLPAELSPQQRRAAITNVVEAHPQIAAVAGLHCVQAMMFTRRLPVPEAVPEIIKHMWARWDGRYPGASGEEIPLPARIIPLARAADLARRAGGRRAVEALTRGRTGTEFDPDLCEALVADADDVFDGLDAPSLWDTFLDAEPGENVLLGPDQALTVAETFADFADQKSGWFAGHSRRVSKLAAGAASRLGLAEDEVERIRLAALMHDIGRAAVQNGIWDKPGELAPRERQIAQSHSLHTASVLALAPALSDLAALAGAAQERADGSGYHRGIRAIEPAMGMLGAANVYDAMTHDRPWRRAFDADAAAEQIQAMCGAGALHGECAAAVLTQAGNGGAVAPVYPAGLTSREVAVLQLLVTGMPTKTVAARLMISAKTADHHIQSIYDKIGVRGRAPVALFALEHGLAAG